MSEPGSIEFVNKVAGDPESKEVEARIVAMLNNMGDILLCQGYAERLLQGFYQQFPVPAGAEKRHSICLDDMGQLTLYIHYKGRVWDILVSH